MPGPPGTPAISTDAAAASTPFVTWCFCTKDLKTFEKCGERNTEENRFVSCFGVMGWRRRSRRGKSVGSEKGFIDKCVGYGRMQPVSTGAWKASEDRDGGELARTTVPCITWESSTETRRPSLLICIEALESNPVHRRREKMWRAEVVMAVKTGGRLSLDIGTDSGGGGEGFELDVTAIAPQPLPNKIQRGISLIIRMSGVSQ